MCGLKFDSDYVAKVNPGQSGPPPQPKDVFELRAMNEAILGGLCLAVPFPTNVTETIFNVSSYDEKNIAVHRFQLAGSVVNALQPAVIYIHGGGAVSCNVNPMFRSPVAQYVSFSGVQCFAVEYRVAPEFPHPTPTEDCYAALKWLIAKSEEFNVDPNRIAVMGDSAGGGIAAGVSLMARDRKLSPPISKQILIYPMLDDRTNIDPESDLNKLLVWTDGFNKLAWRAYIGPGAGDPDAIVSPYAAPARATSVAGLPSTYIDTGSLDLFRDEILVYASRLGAADVEVELHMHPGVPHGYDVGPGDIPIAARAKENRVRVMKSL